MSILRKLRNLRNWCPQPKSSSPKLRNQTAVHHLSATKIPTAKIAIITFTLIMGLSAFVLITVPAGHHPSYAVAAEKLIEKPATYFSLENPDSYVSQAISNPQTSVLINSVEKMQIEQMTANHNSSNIEVNGSYYKIVMIYGDNFPSTTEYTLLWISIAALPLSLAAIMIIVLLKVRSKFLRDKNRNKATFQLSCG